MQKKKPISKRERARRQRAAMASPEAAAKALGLSRNIIYALLQSGIMPAHRIGRHYWVSWATIDQIINGELRLKLAA
jgi:excisionase family DNA binding protein